MTEVRNGYPGNLTPKQEYMLKQLKENIQDVIKAHFDDYFLTRWLRARSWDLKKAEKMLRDSIEWRRKTGVDTILQDWTPPEILLKYYPESTIGFDKDGCPVRYSVLGRIDLKGLSMSSRNTEVIRYKMYTLEALYKIFEERSKELGKHIGNGILIFDLEGTGMKHIWKPAIDVFNEILTITEANYPETTKAIYIINAPSIFPIAFNLVKTFMSEDTKKKIAFLGSHYQKKLLEVIDADQLPVHYGGTMVGEDGDEFCQPKLCIGGQIPESYYKSTADLDHSKFTSVHIARGSTLDLEFEIKETGDALCWQFLTEGHDISFGVFRKCPDKKNDVEVVSTIRVNSHMVPENDSVTCEVPGVYILRFDNGYSWMKGKQLSYFVEILKKPDLEIWNTAL